MKRLIVATMLVTLVAAVVGCAGRPALIPNKDPNLQKSSAQFAADAAKRFPYRADAPRGGEAVARAQVGYALHVLEIVNLSDEDWTDVEVWVNESHVVFIPSVKKNDLKTMQFQMLFDDKGTSFPTKKAMINKVEIYRNGSMYSIPLQLAD